MFEPGRYHLVGVAGVGMSALAELLLDLGCSVTGSDRYFDTGQAVPVIDCLRKMGVRFFPQDGSGLASETRALVVSTAVEADNPELAVAVDRAMPVLHRTEVLAQIVAGQRVVAVTGTSGKSTVTGMLAWMLSRLGADPTVINGAPILNWVAPDRLGSARAGHSGLCLVEADESDKSLLRFKPDWTILTNISTDHFGIEETRALFNAFMEQSAVGVVDMTRGLIRPDQAPELNARECRFVYRGQPFRVGLPGIHNVENALAAIELCRRLGYELGAIGRALADFKGLWRRLEVVGVANGVTVLDDYAHNAAKIEAAWKAVAPHCRKVHCLWRPHGYGPLTKMLPDLAAVFSRICQAGGAAYILPVYDVGGSADRSISSQDLVGRIDASAGRAEMVEEYDTCVDLLLERAGADDAVLCMGARDPGLSLFCRRLLERLQAS